MHPPFVSIINRMNSVGKFLYSIHSGMDVLPQSQPYTSAQIQRGLIKAQGAEHFSHRRKREGVTTSFNLADLSTLDSYARTQFILSEMLLDACLLDGLAKMIGFQFFFQPCLHRVSIGSADRPPYFVHDIAERGQFKFFHIVYLLSLKYSSLIASAFSISFLGVFCVFFTIPCVATIKAHVSVSQKANRR